MNQHSGQAKPSPRPGEYFCSDGFPRRNQDANAFEEPDGQYLRSFVSASQDSRALHGYHGFFNEDCGNANDFNQYQAMHIDSTAETRALHNRRASTLSSPFAPQSHHVILRGIEEYVEATSPRTSGREFGRKEAAFLPETPPTYNMPRRSNSATSGSPALQPMQSLTRFSIDHNAAQDDEVPLRQTKYTPFRYQFLDAVAARHHRREGTRFGRAPYQNPDTDDTIADIENNRDQHVERIYNAMTSGEFAKDNRGSIAMKRWVTEAHYPADLVEAYAHKVLDCLLAQAKLGFRGWVHNDYVTDERKGEDIDKDVDCAGRLDNVIMALEREKTICEDVMNSACQIRMFVNAPRAYANRKHQNRVGNSKRSRTKDTPDPNPRQAKTTKAGGRRTRARSTTASETPLSRDNTPQHAQLLQNTATTGPYYTRATFPSFFPSPTAANQPAPRSTPLHRQTLSATARSSFGQHSVSALSPPYNSTHLSSHALQSQIPSIATIPPHQQSPIMSPPQQPHFRLPAPATPDDENPAISDASFSDWNDLANYDEPTRTAYQHNEPAVDPMLSQWDFVTHSLPLREQGDSSHIFDQPNDSFVNPRELECQSSLREDGSLTENCFQKMWSTPHGIQDFTYPGSS